MGHGTRRQPDLGVRGGPGLGPGDEGFRRLDRPGVVGRRAGGLANHEAVAAAKAGIIGLVLSAAATYASRGIRVNGVAPGLVARRSPRP